MDPENIIEPDATEEPQPADHESVAPPDTTPQVTPQPTAAEIGREMAAALAQSFGTVRVEGQPNSQQRELTFAEKLARLSPEAAAEVQRRFLENPVGTMTEVSQLIAAEERRKLESEARPMVASTGSLLIDSFKARMASEDRYYRQVAPHFDRRMAGVDRAALVAMSESNRNMQLQTVYDAASNDMFRAAEKKAPSTPRAPIIGGGGRVTGPPLGNSGKPAPEIPDVFKKGDDLQRLAQELVRTGALSAADLVWAAEAAVDAI